jgi:hypothetical protein
MQFEKKQFPRRKSVEGSVSSWLPEIHFIEMWALA